MSSDGVSLTCGGGLAGDDAESPTSGIRNGALRFIEPTCQRVSLVKTLGPERAARAHTQTHTTHQHFINT
jgi:hypothetical protein